MDSQNTSIDTTNPLPSAAPQLTPAEKIALQDQLVRALFTVDNFKREVSNHLGVNIEAEIVCEPLKIGAFNLVTYAEAKGRVPELREMLNKLRDSSPPRLSDPAGQASLINLGAVCATLTAWVAWIHVYIDWSPFSSVAAVGTVIITSLGALTKWLPERMPDAVRGTVRAVIDWEGTRLVCLGLVVALLLLAACVSTVVFENDGSSESKVWIYRDDRQPAVPTATLKAGETHREPFFPIPSTGAQIHVRAEGLPGKAVEVRPARIHTVQSHELARPVVIVFTDKELARIGHDRLLEVLIHRGDKKIAEETLKDFRGEPVVIGPAPREIVDEVLARKENEAIKAKVHHGDACRVISRPLSPGDTVKARLRSPIAGKEPISIVRAEDVGPVVRLLVLE